jgi:hypothetical protein
MFDEPTNTHAAGALLAVAAFNISLPVSVPTRFVTTTMAAA